jgi:hypothetical protein
VEDIQDVEFIEYQQCLKYASRARDASSGLFGTFIVIDYKILCEDVAGSVVVETETNPTSNVPVLRVCDEKSSVGCIQSVYWSLIVGNKGKGQVRVAFTFATVW